MADPRKIWHGAAALVMQEHKLLMVKAKESGKWSIPSGGIEKGESPEQACVREVWEETGCTVKVHGSIHTKKIVIKGYDVTTSYFHCKLVEGQIAYHDPDDAIEEIAWKTERDLLHLDLEYPEDLELLLSHLNRRAIEM
ncbi:phosphohydrolase [Planococcus glaciei]|nr:NUDIX hydrolase [Planococcus glaciei]KOF09062.1 phosphohydrolase [Planococcus glaciei]